MNIITKEEKEQMLGFNKYVLDMIDCIIDVRDLYMTLVFTGQYILYKYALPCKDCDMKYITGADTVVKCRTYDMDAKTRRCLSYFVKVRNYIIHYNSSKLRKSINVINDNVSSVNNIDDDFLKDKIMLLVNYGFNSMKEDCCDIKFDDGLKNSFNLLDLKEVFGEV